MFPEEISKRLSETVDNLSAVCTGQSADSSLCQDTLPSLSDIRKIIDLLWQLLFPELFYERSMASRLEYRIGVDIDRLFLLLLGQISRGLAHKETSGKALESVNEKAADLSVKIISKLPEIKRLLYTDIDAILKKDPAAGNEIEIILCYPSIKAMLHYRFAHLLKDMGIPFLPRTIAELSHNLTGIDIHPGANIGEYFAIDHGTGVVIGETCIIGNHVTIYQGVTLGAKSFVYDESGVPLSVPRHPIIEDNVTIYSNASVLGRITIGHDSIIGGNVWVTQSVPPNSRIIQGNLRFDSYKDGGGI